MILLKLIPPIFILFLAFLGFSWLSGMKEEPKKFERPPSAKTVKAKVVEFKQLKPVLSALGQIRSEQPVQLASEVSGVVENENFVLKNGVAFQKGQILLKIDSRRAELQFKTAVSDLMNATANILPEIQVDIPEAFDKWKGFFEKLSFENLPPLPPEGGSKEKLYVSRYNLFKLYFAAETQRINLDKHVLKAPFSGAVVQSQVRPGSTVGQGMALGTLSRTDKYEVEVPISTVEAGWVDVGENVTVKVESTGEKLEGKVSRIAQSLSQQNQTVSLFVTLNKGRSKDILDGMYGQVEIPANTIQTSFEFPLKAIKDGNKIFKISAGKMVEVEVEFLKIGNNGYILSGVAEGDTVALDRLADAIEGMNVRADLGLMPASPAEPEASTSLSAH